MPTFPVIDTHVHLWDTNLLTYPWLNDIPLLNKPYLLADFDAACGPVAVEKFVFVQADVVATESLAETNWVTQLAATDKRIAGIVAHAPLEAGTAVRPHLDTLAQNPLVKGIRRLIQSESDPTFCLQPAFVQAVQMLPDYGFSFDICIVHSQLASVIKLVAQCPNVSFVLDHIGKPDIKNQLFEPWKQEIKMLSLFPNVACKLSGMVTEANHANWQPADLQPYIDHVIRCFGFDRVMFGGDWPVSLLASNYPRWVETLETAVCDCSHKEKQKLFYDNAATFYRLK
ncbi:MAG: amidohydrolase family protein [Chloroflexota bacterium]